MCIVTSIRAALALQTIDDSSQDSLGLYWSLFAGYWLASLLYAGDIPPYLLQASWCLPFHSRSWNSCHQHACRWRRFYIYPDAWELFYIHRSDGRQPEIYLKREDLNHTGSHKINNSLGQALLCLRMGKKKIIAETGAGQHGVATVSHSPFLSICVQIGMCRAMPNCIQGQKYGFTVPFVC